MKTFNSFVVASVLLAVAGTAAAFPDRPVTLVVPFGAGSSVDVNARDFAQALNTVFSQAVVVDNKAGAEGAIGAMAVINGPTDGHTLMFTSSSIPVLEPVIRKNLQYDPIKQFAPICTVGRISNVMNLTGSSPLKSASDLVAAAKAAPGKITFGYSTATTRLAGELFQQATGTKFTSVPYKTSVAAMTDVASGQIDLMFIDHVSASGLYQSGKMRALAVAGSKRIKALPDVPSASELNIPSYNIQPWFGVYISAKAPPATIQQWREIVAQALTSSVAVANMEKRGLETHVVCGDAMNKFQMDEIALWRQVTKSAGIEPE